MSTIQGILLVGLLTSFLTAPAALATTVISPVLELEVDAGTSQPGAVKVYNETDQDLVLTASVEPFTAQGEDGQPRYLPPSEQDKYLGWFSLADRQLLLRSHQVAIVPFTVTVPADAASGGYYAAIFWRTDASRAGDGSAVGISSKVGTLVLLTVTGAVIEQGSVSSFGVEPASNVFFSLPLTFSTRFENTGNVHLKPTGTIALKGWLRAAELPFNAEQRPVLPYTARRFDVVWGQQSDGNPLQQFWRQISQELRLLAGGFYHATLHVSYGTGSPQPVDRELTFWLVPYHLITAAVACVIIFLIIVKINRRIKALPSGASSKS
ncbi:MAG: hypothetical protein A2951_01910 [Candidatus Buchananbacteria bacterium RIFCSPLOWO2_01_FULL_56_15]|uniref:DUF916 domain-containing protein n=2 Tax=Candidatus Buchananiibacteriota TaxID=1817903 RepID=A0A1G1YE59_9BACT|nr:MAG: hypothetical protein A3J59_01315 [Candidatus Buchananbacteria bacterium RIFCSPHIGHO2_02_FULL_56_16]OGY55361.1 MAG: hypothetical protein A2951_01910 [Candidatus Buchananbacteria bacterium RIFCSPLOWO2_01_FULL_56_15]